jgi:membrane protein YqaA with SNARE-associated domain
MEKNAILIGVGYLILLTTIGMIFYKKHEQFRRYGYLGIFLTALISNLSILSPATMIAVVLGGRIYNPMLVGVVAALGSILGEIIAYQVGSSGTSMVEHKPWFARVRGYMEKYGAVTIIAVTAVPQPIVNISGLVAGVIDYPFFKFLLASYTGNWIQHTVTALLGKLTKRVI